MAWSCLAYSLAWSGRTRWTWGESKAGDCSLSMFRRLDVGADRVLAELGEDVLVPLEKVPVEEDLGRVTCDAVDATPV